MPGSKPGERRGGRQKGTPNKAKAAKQAATEAALQTAASLIPADIIDTLTPAEYLDLVWKTLAKVGDIPGSLKIAIEAAPYFNAKMATKQSEDNPQQGGVVIRGGFNPDDRG